MRGSDLLYTLIMEGIDVAVTNAVAEDKLSSYCTKCKPNGVSETQKPSYSFSFLHAKGASSVESNAVGKHRGTSVRAQNSLGCELLC